jgi:thiosulfate/3-mercaptopyruvate sulfurtransferase
MLRVAMMLGIVALSTAKGGTNADLVVTATWLAAHQHDPSIVVLQIDAGDSAYRAGHIPGAHLLRYGSFIVNANGVSTELPTADSLRALLESVGVSTTSHVVLVGSALVVSRAFFTLDFLGLRNVSVLGGGMAAWRAAGNAVERSSLAIPRGRLAVSPHPEIVAQSGWIVAHLGQSGMSLIDTRRANEYAGTAPGVKGHLQGARQLDWQDLFTDPDNFVLKDGAELQRIWSERVVPGDTVVAYCRVGHRSSATYFVSRLLGVPVKLYDGSYEEWAALDLPTTQVATALRRP